MNFTELANKETIDKVIEAMKGRGFEAEFAESKEQALEKIKNMIPPGATVMTGSSVTLEQMGFVDLLKSGNHPWKNLKDGILSEQDPAKQALLRKEATTANYFLGSVHALTEDGVAVIASKSGSQIPAYAFNSDNVVWVIGAQKIVADFSAGMERLEKYVFPLEDEHMKQLSQGKMGSAINKILIYRGESNPAHKIHAIIINEKLGF